MQDIHPKFINSSDFFQHHYNTVAEACASLAEQLIVLRSGGDKSQLFAILDSLRIILQKSYDSIHVPTRVEKIESIPSLVTSLDHYVGVVAHGEKRMQDAGTLLAEHIDAYKRFCNIPHSLENLALDDLTSKRVFCEFCYNVTNAILRQIINHFEFRTADPRKATNFFDFLNIRDQCDPASRSVIEESARSLEGWCSEAKTWLLYDLVRTSQPTVAVEIGIYGGRSLIPIAQALKDNGCGIAIGIESWKAATATHYLTNIANDFWWQLVDFTNKKDAFFRFMVQNDLTRWISVLETSASSAHHSVESIEFLHIDGNHSSFGASADVVNYFTKLKPGGIIVLDDINWISTHPALEIVMSAANLLHVIPLDDAPNTPACAVFRKI